MSIRYFDKSIGLTARVQMVLYSIPELNIEIPELHSGNLIEILDDNA
ncbi:hypothetical protein [Flavobacterium sp. TAB 87]|nr:hypothetical protein [Flavobacterium sp. TAB 87]